MMVGISYSSETGSKILKLVPFNHLRSRVPSILLVIFIFLFPLTPHAAGPAAIVEYVESSSSSLREMDVVKVGKRIRLGNTGVVILGYLNSCLREKIVGGTVVVGRDKSIVKGGKINRERVECDGGNLQFDIGQKGKSAVSAFREQKNGSTNILNASLTVFGTQPVIRVSIEAMEVVIERVDRQSAKVILSLSNSIADLAGSNHILERGGLYKARAGDHYIVFRVDRYANVNAPLLSRLVAF